METNAIAGLRVLDMSRGIAGAYCTKLLADLGAEVILIEPAGGHPLRQEGPFLTRLGRPGESGLFHYLCANKSAVAADLETKEDRPRALSLAREADLFVEDGKPGEMARLGLDSATLQRANPSLVYTSITHFGQTGRWRDWAGSEIADWALGGYMYFGGDPRREPLMIPCDQPAFHAGVQAAIGSLAAVRWAKKTGRGQRVDVSALEALLSAHIWTVARWTHHGQVMRRTGTDVTRCKDGFVRFLVNRYTPEMFLLIDRPDLMDDPRFADQPSWRKNYPEFRVILEAWCLGRVKDEIFRRGQELRIPCAPVWDAEDLSASAILRERNWLVEYEPGLVFPGYPYAMSESPPRLRKKAPMPGETVQGWNERIHGAGNRAKRSKGTGARQKRLPLEGVRVLEITGNWAGPYAGRMLADLGAEVIKIEDPKNPQGRNMLYPGIQPLKHHYNRSAYFNKLHRNKKSLTLDVSTPEGREIFLKLIELSDVFIENTSLRVMRNFNIRYEDLRRVNPQLIYAAISAFGDTGALADYVAYGGNIEAACGLSAVMGYLGEDHPYNSGQFYCDPITASHAAVAVLAALEYRERTGKGQYIDLSLAENGINFFAESFLEYVCTGKKRPAMGNRHPIYAPQGCYPSAGDDMWMVLTVRSDEEWRRFAGVLGAPELQDDRYRTAEGRRRCHDELDAIIKKWTARHDHSEASWLLQRAGISAAPVLTNWEMVSNAHIFDLGFYQTVAHPEMGAFPQPGMPWKLSDSPGKIRELAPLFGAHNAEVLRGLLKLPEERLAVLYKEGIVADVPPPTIPPPAVLNT
jgi:crotonobetainyl-CoA:carnitine CoA-transferase CaiB-like acyl-CoA transferase